jgi:hypothetical protein
VSSTNRWGIEREDRIALTHDEVLKYLAARRSRPRPKEAVDILTWLRGRWVCSAAHARTRLQEAGVEWQTGVDDVCIPTAAVRPNVLRDWAILAAEVALSGHVDDAGMLRLGLGRLAKQGNLVSQRVEALEAVLAAVLAGDPLRYNGEYPEATCAHCGRTATYNGFNAQPQFTLTLHDHKEDCPWRQANETLPVTTRFSPLRSRRAR